MLRGLFAGFNDNFMIVFCFLFTGHELLVWYGDDYASDLGIEKENYSASVIPGGLFLTM